MNVIPAPNVCRCPLSLRDAHALQAGRGVVEGRVAFARVSVTDGGPLVLNVDHQGDGERGLGRVVRGAAGKNVLDRRDAV